MSKQKRSTSTKRFGTRYGRTNKDKVAEIEKRARDTYECPYCHKEKVTRVMAGIWKCGKCGKKFSGKAYTVSETKSGQEGE